MDVLKIRKVSENPEYTKEIADIYTGEEIMRFNKRHPIYKTLMKLEFEDVLRNFKKELVMRGL
ncbi:MAG: hypothetical protein ACFFCG_11665 [Promethearchaeota archaeon]